MTLEKLEMELKLTHCFFFHLSCILNRKEGKPGLFIKISLPESGSGKHFSYGKHVHVYVSMCMHTHVHICIFLRAQRNSNKITSRLAYPFSNTSL